MRDNSRVRLDYGSACAIYKAWGSGTAEGLICDENMGMERLVRCCLKQIVLVRLQADAEQNGLP